MEPTKEIDSSPVEASRLPLLLAILDMPRLAGVSGGLPIQARRHRYLRPQWYCSHLERGRTQELLSWNRDHFFFLFVIRSFERSGDGDSSDRRQAPLCCCRAPSLSFWFCLRPLSPSLSLLLIDDERITRGENTNRWAPFPYLVPLLVMYHYIERLDSAA